MQQKEKIYLNKRKLKAKKANFKMKYYKTITIIMI